MSNICEQVFGKAFGLLSADEMKEFRRVRRAVEYFRRHDRNKGRQRQGKRDAKTALLTALGWSPTCQQCGYDRYIGALDFHHVDPHTKDDRVTTVEEARKCRLLCANCHREAHWHMRMLAATPISGRPRQAADPLVEKYLRALVLPESVIANYLSGRLDKSVQ